jgi:3-deoxy-manno-octulosonate cytidylyltransferase (CMP-KDO synthetase)
VTIPAPHRRTDQDGPIDLADTFDLIVVPARFGSSRLPGKPLIKLAGRTLLERVVAVAQTSAEAIGRCKVLVATDDDRVSKLARSLGVDAVMTSDQIVSGTDRAFSAAIQLPHPPKHIVNLQGDSPFIPASIVTDLLQALRGGTADVATPVFQLDWERLERLREHKRTAPFSGTTCVRDSNGKALWFSKSLLPAIRNEAGLRTTPLSPVWQHLGLYAYTMAALEWFSAAAPSYYETIEGLEQLRFLENDWKVDTLPVEVPSYLLSGIDTPEDLAKAEDAISRYGDPFAA